MYFKNKFLKNNSNSIFQEIFEKIYSRLECKIIYVFLCGGDCKTSGIHQIRDIIKDKLENYPNAKIRVLYPEEIFFDKDNTLADHFRDKDLLELETILANNSNIVCIICESFGSATELGAFTNYKDIDNNELLNKLVVVTYSKYDKPSFISEGPIKRLTTIKGNKSRHKIYKYTDDTNPKEYSINQDCLTNDLAEEFKKICKQNNKRQKDKLFIQKDQPIKNFIGLAYLILLFIYFYDGIATKYLKPMLKTELNKMSNTEAKIGQGVSHDKEIDFFYPISINFLLDNQKFIIKDVLTEKYTLTSKGLRYVKEILLNYLNINICDIDYIRIRAMYHQYYNNMKGDYIS